MRTLTQAHMYFIKALQKPELLALGTSYSTTEMFLEVRLNCHRFLPPLSNLGRFQNVEFVLKIRSDHLFPLL